jgi:hypothetical protein
MQENETAVEEIPAPVAEEPKTEGEQPEGEVEVKAEGEDTPEVAEAKKQSKFQRRLERQKTARIAAETETRLLRERVAALEAERAPKPKDETPKRDDYADDVAYLEARADHAARKAAAEARAAERNENEGREKQSKHQQAEAKIAQAWTEREATFQATAKDYTEVVEPFVQDDLAHFSDGSKRLIVESEVGPQLLYHLATNPEEAERIAELSPLRQIAEIGKLEDKMQKPVRKTSSAPAPIDPVPQGRSGHKDPAKMSVTEFAKWMKDNGSRYVR